MALYKPSWPFKFKNSKTQLTLLNSLIKKLSNVLNEYTLTTDDNKTVNVGEKRIYAPNVVAVVNGEVKILETGISTEETNPYMKLTKEMKSDSKKAFKKVFKYINK